MSAPRFAPMPAAFHWAGEGAVVCRIAGRPDLPTIPAYLADLLKSCSGFRPLAEHVARYAAAEGLPAAERADLARAADELVAAGLMVSEEETCRRIGAAAGETREPPPGIGFAGIPTAGSPARLARCIRAFAENARAAGHRPELFVADNSRDPAVATENGAVAEAVAREFSFVVRHFGPGPREAYAERLAARAGCDPDLIRFALCNPAPGTFAAGINRNLILLAAAGRTMLSLDDDAVCHLRFPGGDPAPLTFSSGRDPMLRRFYPSREAALAAAPESPGDFLGEHARLLGRAVGDCVAALDPGREGLATGKFGGPFLERLLRAGSKVVATFTGQFLDPGIPTSTYYYMLPGESLARLADSEAGFHAAMVSRAASGMVPGPVIGDFTLSPGIAFGLDARGLVPPWFPHHHAEDFSHGALLWGVCPDGFAGYPACSILHDPGPGKPILGPRDLDGLRPCAMFEVAHGLRAIFAGAGAPAAGEAGEDAIRRVARHVAGFAGPGEEAFAESWRELVLAIRDGGCARIERRLWEERDLPDFLREEMARFLSFQARATEEADFDIPLDLRGGGDAREVRRALRGDLLRFARLLEAWPAIFEAARDCPP